MPSAQLVDPGCLVLNQFRDLVPVLRLGEVPNGLARLAAISLPCSGLLIEAPVEIGALDAKVHPQEVPEQGMNSVLGHRSVNLHHRYVVPLQSLEQLC